MTENYQVWLNGEMVPRNEASISMLDRGFRLGDAVFDTTRTFDGKIFRLQDHLVRLYRSLHYTRIDPGFTMEEMGHLTQEVVRCNESVREPGDDYMITQIVTRGVNSYRAAGEKKATVCIWVDPMEYVRYAPAYESGFNLVIAKTRSHSPDQLDPKVKNYNRLHFVMADLEAFDVDPTAIPLLLDLQGNVTESMGSNFFLVSEGVLKTPGDHAILQGVSRMTVFELADRLGIPVSEEDIQPYDVYTADEAFLTTTPYSILPIGRVDNRKIGEQIPGPITNQLLAAWSELVGMDIVGQYINGAKVQASRDG